MNRIGTWLDTSPLASWVSAFVTIVIAMAVAHWATDFVIDFDQWQVWVVSGLVATLAPLKVALNPADPRWGRGASK